MKKNELEIWNRRVSRLLLQTHDRRLEQLKKWKLQSHDLTMWMTILGEEHGELCKEVLSLKFGDDHMLSMYNLRKEALDVAAVALAIAQCAEFGES